MVGCGALGSDGPLKPSHIHPHLAPSHHGSSWYFRVQCTRLAKSSFTEYPLYHSRGVCPHSCSLGMRLPVVMASLGAGTSGTEFFSSIGIPVQGSCLRLAQPSGKRFVYLG